MLKTIAAITTVRNDEFFLAKWIRYYGEQFGQAALFVVLDGHDQEKVAGCDAVNFISVPHEEVGRAEGDRSRALFMSDLAHKLFSDFDIVIATDVDEFIVVDPRRGISLAEYLSDHSERSSLSSLGLDVAQNRKLEAALVPDQPILDQRRFAIVSSRYTKPNITFRPLTWGSGLHRIKGENYRIDPHLYLFHFGLADYEMTMQKRSEESHVAEAWSKHLDRRERAFEHISNAEHVHGEEFFVRARRRQTWLRPLFALNKPLMVPKNVVIEIPERFRGIV